MAYSKTHLTIGCGRRGRMTTSVYAVTCLACQRTEAYLAAKEVADAAHKAAFEAQEPRRLIEPWHSGNVPMVCRSCGNDTFREGDRTCYGHYANFVCAGCGHTESRLTETGMSF